MAEEWIESMPQACKCAACGTLIRQGDPALVDSEGGMALCRPCGVTLQKQEQDPSYAYAYEDSPQENAVAPQDQAAQVESMSPVASAMPQMAEAMPPMADLTYASAPGGTLVDPRSFENEEPAQATNAGTATAEPTSIPEAYDPGATPYVPEAEPVATPPSQPAPSQPMASQAPADFANADDPAAAQDLWNRFYSYMASCFRSDMIDGLVGVNGKRWAFASTEFETIICQGVRSLGMTPDLLRLVSRMVPSQSLQYGWPLVAVDTREGLKVAPLLVVEMAPPPYPGDSISAYGEPVINPAIIRALWSNSGDVSFLHAQMSDGLPTTGPGMARFTAKLAALMGVPVVDELDPLSLQTGMPTAPGVYNVACAIIVESLVTAKPVVEEIRQAATNKEWQQTAASFLFGPEPAPLEGRDTMPLMPWSAEPAFEQALQLVRHQPLNVFEMSQRDTIDHLIVSACANAWLDNESVLVVSDDDNKLDELARLAVDIHPGLLIRAVVDADVEHNQSRVVNTVSRVAAAMINEIQAAKDSIAGILEKSGRELEKAASDRQQAVQGATERAKLVERKVQLEKTRLDSAKRIWTHGLFPRGTNSRDIGLKAKALQRSWFLTTMRTKMLIASLKGKSTATLKDVMTWCMSDLEVKEVDNKLATEYADLDRYNIGQANYRWADVSIRATSATISGNIVSLVPQLEDLSLVRRRDLSAKRIISSVQNDLKAWAIDYRTVSDFFELKPGLFDLVIMDNTHRMNLAWALPIIFRAKRLVIIGDPRAARPSVFLDDMQLNNTAARYGFDRGTLAERGLDYGSSSVYAAFSHA